jgi:hypothetical protein
MAIAQSTSRAIQAQRANVRESSKSGYTETDEDELDDANDTNPTCFFNKLSHFEMCDVCLGRVHSGHGSREETVRYIRFVARCVEEGDNKRASLYGNERCENSFQLIGLPSEK